MKSKLLKIANLLEKKGLTNEATQLASFAEYTPQKREVTVFNSCIRDVEEWLLIMKPKANLVSCNPDKLKELWENIYKALNKFEDFCNLDMH